MILTAAVLALCLAGTPSAAEEDDFSDIAGVWYAEDATMTVTEEGRFAIESIDGDWTGSLKAERRHSEIFTAKESAEELRGFSLVVPGIRKPRSRFRG